jgi:hypothetical protein
VPGLDSLSLLMFPVSTSLPTGLLAYGPLPGVEFIPQFLALLAWAGLAFTAVLLAPFTALLRWLRRVRGAQQAPQVEAKSEQSVAAPSADAGAEKGRDTA